MLWLSFEIILLCQGDENMLVNVTQIGSLWMVIILTVLSARCVLELIIGFLCVVVLTALHLWYVSELIWFSVGGYIDSPNFVVCT